MHQVLLSHRGCAEIDRIARLQRVNAVTIQTSRFGMQVPCRPRQYSVVSFFHSSDELIEVVSWRGRSIVVSEDQY